MIKVLNISLIITLGGLLYVQSVKYDEMVQEHEERLNDCQELGRKIFDKLLTCEVKLGQCRVEKTCNYVKLLEK